MAKTEGENKLKERLLKVLRPTRRGTGIPPWLVSDIVVSKLIGQLDVWLPLLAPLGLDKAATILESTPIDQIPDDEWERQCRTWGEVNQVRDTFLALDRLLHSIGTFLECGQFPIEPSAIQSVLPVLGVLNFTPEGKRLLPELAHALECKQQAPAQVIDCFRAALECERRDKAAEAQSILASDPIFGAWLREFGRIAMRIDLPAKALPLQPTELAVSVLLDILEGGNDNDRRNN